MQQLYESVHGLAIHQMTDHDLSSDLNRAQSTVEELKLMSVSDDLQKVFSKLENMFMVFVLHGIHNDFESVWNQNLSAAD